MCIVLGLVICYNRTYVELKSRLVERLAAPVGRL